MDPTIVLSSLLILFFFGFNGDQFLGTDTITVLALLERATKAISGGTIISGLNTAFDAVIGTSRTPPPPPPAAHPSTGHSWNESCTEMPASVYAPSVFEKPVRARVCFPDGMVGILGNSTEPLEWPVPSSAPPESFSSHLLSSYTDKELTNMTITILCILVPFYFLMWTSLTRKPSTVDDETTLKKGYVDAAIAEISNRIPDLAPLLSNQRRLEGQLIQIEGAENRVNGRTDDRIHELKVLFQKQIRDIDLTSLTSRADSFQKNHELVASQVRKLQEDQPRWALLAEDFKTLKTDLTTQIERTTDRVETHVKGHVEHINRRILDIENQDKKIVVDVEKISKEQTACNAMIDQVEALEKQVTDHVASNSRLQRQQVDDIDALTKKFKDTKDDVAPVAEKLRKLQLQVNGIDSANQRVSGLEDEIASIDERIQKLQEQGAADIKASKEKVKAVESQIAATTARIKKLQDQETSDPKRVKDVESKVTSLKELIRELQEQEASDSKQVRGVKSEVASLKEQIQGLQEQRQADNTTKAQSQKIQTSLNQRIAKVETELHQIPVVKNEEERAHTKMLLENEIEKLKIDELRSKLQNIESSATEDTQNILYIQHDIAETKSKIDGEFSRTTKDTEKLINSVVKDFGAHLDDIRKIISTLQDDFKENTPNNETIAKLIEDLKKDLKIAKEKGRSLELKVFGSSLEVAEGTPLSVMEKIDELQSQLQKLDSQHQLFVKEENILAQKRSTIGTQASSQSSEPPQTPTPSGMNASVGDFIPSPQPKDSQSQEDKWKGKERASTLSSQSSTTDGKSQKPPAKSTAKVDSFALNYRLKTPQEKEEDYQRDLLQRQTSLRIGEAFAARSIPGGLAKSRWASTADDSEQQESQKGPPNSKTPPRQRKGGKGSKS